MPVVPAAMGAAVSACAVRVLPPRSAPLRGLMRLATSTAETATLRSTLHIYDVSQGGYLDLGSQFVAYLMAMARVSRAFMGVLIHWFH